MEEKVYLYVVKSQFMEMLRAASLVKPLCDVVGSIQTGKLDANAEEKNGIYPFFTCDSIPKRINTYAFDTEAILVSGNGSQIGHINYYSGKFNAYQRTYVLSMFDSKIECKYLVFYFRSFLKPYIMENAKGSAIPYMTLPILKAFKIHIPEYDTQVEICRIIEQADKSRFSRWSIDRSDDGVSPTEQRVSCTCTSPGGHRHFQGSESLEQFDIFSNICNFAISGVPASQNRRPATGNHVIKAP